MARRHKREHDANITAFNIVKKATEEDELEDENTSSGESDSQESEDTGDKNPHAVALGREGGKKGGKARAAKLTPERRREIARAAARTRWGKEQS